MSEFAQYAIIRFRPFPETGEFANVGILMFDPTSAMFQYKIVPRRFRRVTQFFNALEPNVFGSSVLLLQQELDRLKALLESREHQRFLMSGLLRRDRESVWTFSDLRTVRIDGEPEDTLDKLYELYVGRNFVTSEYQEQIMVREVRRSLKRRGIDGYGERIIEDEIVPVKFPLVSEVRGTRVIKPISLNQKTTIGMIDHAATWHDRFRLLIDRGRLDREKILIPLAGPTVSDKSMSEAYKAARDELVELQVNVIEFDDVTSLIDFAKLGARPAIARLY